MHRVFAFWLLLLGVPPCFAGDIKEVDTYVSGVTPDAYIGEEFRVDVTRAILAAQRGNDRAAWGALSSVLAFCDEQRGSDEKPVFSVTNDAEAKEYLGEARPHARPRFIDHACPAAYKTAAFLSVRAKESNAAFDYLDRAQKLAPHWAEPLAERAYLIGSLGDRAASLEMYQRSLTLVEKYPSSTYLKPLVLRGIGFALIELDRLDEAQLAFEASLEVEPRNELAKNELIYIEQIRERKAASN